MALGVNLIASPAVAIDLEEIGCGVGNDGKPRDFLVIGGSLHWRGIAPRSFPVPSRNQTAIACRRFSPAATTVPVVWPSGEPVLLWR